MHAPRHPHPFRYHCTNNSARAHQTTNIKVNVMVVPLILGSCDDVVVDAFFVAGLCGEDDIEGRSDEFDAVLNSNQSRTRSIPPPELDRSNIVLGCILCCCKTVTKVYVPKVVIRPNSSRKIILNQDQISRDNKYCDHYYGRRICYSVSCERAHKVSPSYVLK